MDKLFEDIRKDILEREEELSQFACKSKNAILLYKEKRSW